MVVPRFGARVVGGAENLIRGLATRAASADQEIEIATTCAEDHTTWLNSLPAGETREDGLMVRRFAVGPRVAARHAALHQRLHAEGSLPYLDELELMAQGVWSPDMQRFLERRGEEYDLIVLAPYLFGTTYWGAQAWPERSAILPCLHDEPDAHMRVVRDLLGCVSGCIFNSPGEERLARRLAAVRGGGVVGLGFDAPAVPPPEGFARRHGLGRYLIYAGRLEEAKRVQMAVAHTARYARERAPDLRLVLIGSGGYRPSGRDAAHALPLGYLSEEDKRSALAEAVALVNPSELESLSIVLMEAWLEGTPALVAAGSEVMRDHVASCGGGFVFADYEGFAAGLDSLLGDPAETARMGRAGRDYTLDRYGWPEVSRRFGEVTHALAGSRPALRR